MKKCKCCDGETVFTCEMCGNGLAINEIPFTDTSGTDLDPNLEHAIWVCDDCKKRKLDK